MNKPSLNSPRRGVGVKSLNVETLESRRLMSVQFQFDYRYDASGFFSDPARRAVLEAAGNSLTGRLTDVFSAVTPSGSNTFSVNLRNPSTGDATSIVNPSIGTDKIIIYVGARDLEGSTLGQGGPNGWSASGTTDWTKLVRGRGQSGATATPRTDFAPKTGSIAFDNGANWFFGQTTSGITSTQTDFYSVAVHELGHVLGVGAGSETWAAQASGGFFNGPKAKALYGGPVPLEADGVHFKEGIQSGGQESALDPTLKRGTRKDYTPLDFAALDDIGWDVKPVATINGSVFVDKDADNYRDASEIGVSGVTVFIDTDKDNVIDAGEKTTVTDANGRYSFTGLAAGSYRVVEYTPKGYTVVAPTTGYRTVSVTSGQTKNSQDFSVKKNTAPGTVKGIVFNDVDSDGYRDSGEGLLSGWRVFADYNYDGVLSAGEPTATSDKYGNYSLSLTPGNYRIIGETKGGYRRSGPSTGYHDVTIESGTTLSSRSFGFTQKILLSGRVFKDLDGDGLKDSNEVGLRGWRVYIDTNNNGKYDSGEVNVFSNSSGDWNIKNLTAGTYTVRIAQQSYYTLQSPGTGRYSVTLTTGGTKTNLNFAERPN